MFLISPLVLCLRQFRQTSLKELIWLPRTSSRLTASSCGLLFNAQLAVPCRESREHPLVPPSRRRRATECAHALAIPLSASITESNKCRSRASFTSAPPHTILCGGASTRALRAPLSAPSPPTWRSRLRRRSAWWANSAQIPCSFRMWIAGRSADPNARTSLSPYVYTRTCSTSTLPLDL